MGDHFQRPGREFGLAGDNLPMLKLFPSRFPAGLPLKGARTARAALASVAIVAALGGAAGPVAAQAFPDWEGLKGPGHWRAVVSPVTQHWRPSDEHRHVWAVGAERWTLEGTVAGGAFFNNSFGQPSGYAYLGRRYTGLLGQPTMYAQWTAGLMYGYKGQYASKVPLNHNGFSPGAVLALGFEFTPQTALQYNLLGDAGVMFQISHRWR